MILFFDTETTGLVNFKAPSSDPSQPRLVQLGMIVCEDSGEEVFQLGAIIKPRGFTIPDKVAELHGISQQKAELCGVELGNILPLFSYWMCRSDLHVCHNYKFDATVMDSELTRANCPYIPQNYFCTMQEMTGVCRLRQTTSNRFKWPKLQEAYQFVFGKNFDKAHDALADVRACKEIYFWLQSKSNVAPEIGTREAGLNEEIIETQTIANHGLSTDRLQIDNPAHLSVLPVSNIDLIK